MSNVFERLKITASSLHKIDNKSKGWVDFEKFFSFPLSNPRFFNMLDSINKKDFGSNWQTKLYQDGVNNLSKNYERYLFSRENQEQRHYIGNGMVGCWYGDIEINGNKIRFMQFDEPKSPPTKMLLLENKTLKDLK